MGSSFKQELQDEIYNNYQVPIKVDLKSMDLDDFHTVESVDAPIRPEWSQDIEVELDAMIRQKQMMCPFYFPMKDPPLNEQWFEGVEQLPGLTVDVENFESLDDLVLKDDVFDSNPTVVIKSPMGTGKTVRTYRWLRSFIHMHFPKKPRILIISFRRTLERKYTNDLAHEHFVNYEDIEKVILSSDEFPRLVVQINSLWRVEGRFDVVLLDEMSYTWDTLLGYCARKTEVINHLNQYMRSDTATVIALDAFITRPNIEWLYVKRGRQKMKVIDNILPADPNKKVKFLHKTLFEQRILKDLKAGKKLVIASNNKHWINNELLPLIEEMQKEDPALQFEIVKHTANDDEEVDVSRWDSDVVKLVIYSPTITAGISYETRQKFHCRYGYFINASAGADLCAQMLFRVRDTIHSVIYLCCEDKATKDLPTTQEGLEDYLYNYANIARDSDFYGDMVKFRQGILDYNVFKRKYTKNSQYWLVVDFFRKRHLSRNYFPNRLMGYLTVQRWTASQYKVEDGECEDAEDQRIVNKGIIKAHQMETVTNTAKQYKEQIAHIPVNQEEYALLKNKKRKSPKVKMRLNLFQIKQVLPNVNLLEMEDSKLLNLIKHWSAFLFEKEFRDSEMEDPIEYCVEQFHRVGHPNDINLHQQFKRDRLVRARHVLELLKICGFAFSDVGDKIKKVTITEEMMAGVTNFIVPERLNDFHLLFAVSNDPTKFEFVNVEDKNRGRQRFSTLMTKCLKHLGLKLGLHDGGKKKKSRSKRSKKIKKYSLQRMFDVN